MEKLAVLSHVLYNESLLDKTNCTFLLIDYNDQANYQKR